MTPHPALAPWDPPHPSSRANDYEHFIERKQWKRQANEDEHTEAFHIWIARSPEGELRQVRNELDTFVAKIIVYEDECIEVEFSKDDQ